MNNLFRKLSQSTRGIRTIFYGFGATSAYLSFLYLSDDGVKSTNYPDDVEQLPFCGLSKAFSFIAHWQPPRTVKEKLIKGFIWLNEVDLTDCDEDIIEKSSSLADFFTRPLRLGARSIDQNSSLISPCDSVVLVRGKINDKNPHIPQVKGSTFSVEEFFGPLGYKVNVKRNELNKGQKTNIYYCVLYLSPKDYHRFHVPTDWKISYRRYFPGKLMPVRPTWTHKLPGLFAMNERVCYIGQWGPKDTNWLMAYAPVAAFLVGGININQDPEFSRKTIKELAQKSEESYFEKPLEVKKGEEFGRFNFGSTIVLMFEAPKNLEWNVNNNETVRMGQSLIKNKF